MTPRAPSVAGFANVRSGCRARPVTPTRRQSGPGKSRRVSSRPARGKSGGSMPQTTPSAGTLIAGVAYAAKAGRAVLRDPHEGLLRAADVLADRTERRRRPFAYEADADWHRSLHAHLGSPWPCRVEPEFRRRWAALVDEMSARGLAVGRATFGGWDDGGPALALAAYCLARTLRPEKVVETGVARGVTTRLLLEALERESTGH